jgi:prevent-host-death family protein
MVMKTISAAAFTARCLPLMDDVKETREPVVIPKRGKPVAKLVSAS